MARQDGASRDVMRQAIPDTVINTTPTPEKEIEVKIGIQIEININIVKNIH
ncbi:MAG: hypothetical protein GY696_27010 [Gammaproteobacteria bacterium]|nr:hypothetical protein [Gammaproteobacteria bacterium]